MFRRIFNAIVDEFDTGQVHRDIMNHWLCRCTVPGPGMRKAGEILKRRYLENGATSAEVIPYPADDRTEYLDGAKNQLEWRPYGASLTLLASDGTSETICRYEDEPLCLTCYSVATPPEGVEADIVLQYGPLKPDDVQEGQWAGKIVFTDQFPSTVAAAIGKSGAAGMVSDCVSPPWLVQYPPVREPQDVPDLTMWTIFGGHRDQPQIFGFNLSPRQGMRLRNALRQAEGAGTAAPRLRAIVQAETLEGSSDMVNAALKGTEKAEEEIWVLAHLSEPGSRDNASGCCTSLEMLRTLKALTESGKLPPLRRTLRFMHGVEVSGFLPYINEHKADLPKVVAGLCCDSIAQDFGICGGEMVLYRAPEQNASFIDGLMQTLMDAVAKEPAKRFTSNNYATYPWHTEPFFGNDAFISDGFFDIPAPQLTAWADRYYHSNLDTPDQIDDNTLGRSGSLLAAYLYILAAAGPAEARWLGSLAAQDFKQRIALRLNEFVTEHGLSPFGPEQAKRAADELWHLGLQGQDAVMQAARFAPHDSSVQAHLEALAKGVSDVAAHEATEVLWLYGDNPQAEYKPFAVPAEAEGASLTVRRLRWRPAAFEGLAEPAKAVLGQLKLEGLDWTRLWPWINGRRNAAEITERLQFGGSVSLAEVVRCLQALVEAGLAEPV